MSIATILLVESNLEFAEIMVRRLTKRNVNVITVYSGREALDLLAENDRIEVVLLDDKMEVMHGFETLKLMRTLFPLVEVIMFSGHAAIEAAICGLSLGAFEYVMKLCDAEYLVEKLQEAAARKREQEEKIFQAKLREFIPIQARMEDALYCLN